MTSESTKEAIRSAVARSADRFELWTNLLRDANAQVVAEVGVFRGEFARRMLESCPRIRSYYLIDPWRPLPQLDKPLPRTGVEWEQVREEAMAATEAHADRRVVLQGTTGEIVDRLPDRALDCAYIDGDHTLRGIATDLVRIYPKIRDGGWLGGDDFCTEVWQHGPWHEPTLVCPFAVYFAEAVDAPIFLLPWNQFLIGKGDGGHEIVDLAGRYSSFRLGGQLRSGWRTSVTWLLKVVRKRLRRYRGKTAR